MTLQTKTKTAIIYCRISSLKQASDGDGLNSIAAVSMLRKRAMRSKRSSLTRSRAAGIT